MNRILALVAVMALAGAVAMAADWPQFRGSARDGISPEKGLLQSWPEGGPKLLWENKDVGFGFSSLSVVDGKVYTSGNVGDSLAVTALDASGKKLWQTPVDKATKGGNHPGSRSTPTIDGIGAYIVTDGGKLICLRTSDGKVAWTADFSQYGAKSPTWAFAESPLILGDMVICAPGGQVSVVALDKKTGKEIWKAEPVDGVTAYASAVAINYGGLTQIVTFSAKSVFGVDAKTGKVLWKEAHKTAYDVNATSVVFSDGILYITSGYGTGGEAFEMTVSGSSVSVKSLWTNKAPDDQMGGVVLVDGMIYGTGHKSTGLTAIALKGGEIKYTNKGIGQSSVIFGDGRLYVQDYNGPFRLVDPAEGKVVGEMSFQKTKGAPLWAHPAISDGKLYIRHDDVLSVYDIKAK